MRASRRFAISSNALVNIAAAVFITPFMIFSATAGQLADNAPDFIYREPSNGSGGFHQLKPFGGKDTHNLTDVDW